MPQQDRGADEAARHGQTRSSHWPSVERTFREAHPDCAACDPNTAVDHVGIQIHHVHPFHLCIAAGRPDLELDPRNLISLGETEHAAEAPDHHLLLGHLDDFKSYNLMVIRDCVLFQGMGTDAIKASPIWVARERQRPLDQLSPADLTAFRAMLDRDLPPDLALVAKYGLTVTPA